MDDIDTYLMDQDSISMPSYEELLSHAIRMDKECSDKDIEIRSLKDRMTQLEMQLAYYTFMFDDSSSSIQPLRLSKPVFMVRV